MKINKTLLLVDNAILMAALSAKQAFEGLTMGSSTTLSFNCFFCGKPFLKKLNDFNRQSTELERYSVCCREEACKKKKTMLANRKKVLKSGNSLGLLYPSLTIEFCGFVDKYEDELLTAYDISAKSHRKANWKCAKKAHHTWPARISNRVLFPKCPFCEGVKVHVLDSVYTLLLNEGMLDKLDEQHHEIAKTKKECSKTSLRFFCKRCNTPRNYSSYKEYKRSQGCRKCWAGERAKLDGLRKRIKNGEKSVADSPKFSKQYCFSQPEIPVEFKNKIHPRDMPATFTSSVYWRCESGHITSASPSHRVTKGHMCGKCSPHTSKIECLFFVALKNVLQAMGLTVLHRVNLVGKESDIYIADVSEKRLSVEIDGFQWHKDKESEDSKKDNAFEAADIGTLRLREEGLKTLDSTRFTVSGSFNDMTSLLASSIRHINLYFSTSISTEISTDELLYYSEQADTYYESIVDVPFEESVAFLVPEALKWIDCERTSLRLENLRPHSMVKLAWKDPDSDFRKIDTVQSRCKTGVFSRFIELTNQVVTQNNCVSSTHPTLAEYFVDASKHTIGTGSKVEVKCGFPHVFDKDLNVDTKEQAMCGQVRLALPPNVIKQIEKKGHCWDFKCRHKGHLVFSEDSKDMASKGISQAARQRKHKFVKSNPAFKLMELYYLKQFLKTFSSGLTCKMCRKHGYQGYSQSRIAELFAEYDGFFCFYCLNSGNVLSETSTLVKELFDGAKPILDSFEDIYKGWKLDKTSNKFGVKFKTKNGTQRKPSYLISMISPKDHICELDVSKLSDFSGGQCFCVDCIEVEGREKKKMLDNERIDTFLNKLKKAYPAYRLLETKGKEFIVNCGSFRLINGRKVAHADFSVNLNMTDIFLDKSKVLCACCAIDKGNPLIKGHSFGYIHYRFSVAAAYLDKEVGTIEYEDGKVPRMHDKIKTRRQRFLWDCANPDHEKDAGPTADNFLRPTRKGYCRMCLKEKGVKTLSELIQIVEKL